MVVLSFSSTLWLTLFQHFMHLFIFQLPRTTHLMFHISEFQVFSYTITIYNDPLSVIHASCYFGAGLGPTCNNFIFQLFKWHCVTDLSKKKKKKKKKTKGSRIIFNWMKLATLIKRQRQVFVYIMPNYDWLSFS